MFSGFRKPPASSPTPSRSTTPRHSQFPTEPSGFPHDDDFGRTGNTGYTGYTGYSGTSEESIPLDQRRRETTMTAMTTATAGTAGTTGGGGGVCNGNGTPRNAGGGNDAGNGHVVRETYTSCAFPGEFAEDDSGDELMPLDVDYHDDKFKPRRPDGSYSDGWSDEELDDIFNGDGGKSRGKWGKGKGRKGSSRTSAGDDMKKGLEHIYKLHLKEQERANKGCCGWFCLRVYFFVMLTLALLGLCAHLIFCDYEQHVVEQEEIREHYLEEKEHFEDEHTHFVEEKEHFEEEHE